MSAIDWQLLTARASSVRERAYAPYSSYAVGAAILAADGRIFAGCNVENASYGLCLCAERSAVAQLVAEGAPAMVALVVVTAGPEAGSPCGLCLQTLAEFAEELPIGLAIAGDDRPRVVRSLSELLPHAFRGDLVKR
jgi:cytidine deaminase